MTTYTTLDLSIYVDYADESCSSRWGTRPPPNPSRRIILSHPDGVKSPGLGGPPNYHPGAMSHSERDLLSQGPLYAAPLAYYALKALKPWFYKIGAAEQLLSSQSSVSATRGDERANLGDIVAPWAQWNITRLDPLTWAFLIQNYHDLPNHYLQYQIALNDPNLSALSALPSTPRFSIVTVLDLSKCADLHDTNITQLKVLGSLCVLDTSSTGLTDQGVKNLKSTLVTSEPGPLHLRSWNLRGCIGITNRVLESLGAFPLLCVLDLRATSVTPSRSGLPLIWDSSSLLPPGDYAEYFWPHPQVKVPALLQTLGNFVFRHSAKHPKTVQPAEPYVVHVDRQAPRVLERPTSPFGTTSITRLNRKTYLVNDSYGQPAEEASRFTRSKDRELATYPYEDYDLDCYGHSGNYEYSDDEYRDYNSGTSGSDVEQDHAQEDSASEDSLADLEVRNTHLLVNLGHDQVSSPREVSSTLDSDDDLFAPEQSTVGSSRSRSPDRLSTAARPQPTDGLNLPTQLNPISPTFSREMRRDPADLSWANHVVQQQPRSETSTSSFYNARAQAGLAPPKRKRYTDGSSQGYSSGEDMQVFSSTELKLMLIRKPPPWSTRELLAASVSRKPPSHQQVKVESSIISSTKKRKVDPKGATALWAHIKATSKHPGDHSHQPSTLTTPMALNASPKPPSQSIQASQRTVATGLPSAAPVRRTPLGRAPRAPGAVVPKHK